MPKLSSMLLTSLIIEEVSGVKKGNSRSKRFVPEIQSLSRIWHFEIPVLNFQTLRQTRLRN
jgi:hypothetical protein